MSLVTRVSIAFLVALALALGGFSATLYYLAGLRLRLALDQELEATLDRFPDRPAGLSGRVIWAIFDETGRRVEEVPGGWRPTGLDSFSFGPVAVDFEMMTVLDGRDLTSLAVDVATTIEGSAGHRWRVLARKIGGGPPRGPREAGEKGHRHGSMTKDERKGGGPGMIAPECWPPGRRWSRWRPRSAGWG